MKNTENTTENLTNKKTQKSKLQAFLLLFIQLTGFVGGGACAGAGANRISETLSFSGFKAFLVLLFMIFAVLILFFITVIIHEAGHMVFGCLSGYSYSSFRIGSFILVKKQDKLVLKRFTLPGTGGQCLMKPPAYSEDMPVVMYNLGGCLFNFIFGAVGIILAFVFADNVFIFPLSLAGAILNITLGLSNVLPLKAGISTDGRNLFLLKQDSREKYALWLQLYFNAYLSEGKSLLDFPEELAVIPDNIDYSSYMQASGAPFIRLAWLEAKGEYEAALALCEEILEKASLIDLQKMELECEKILLAAITQGDRDIVTELFTNQLQKYVLSVRDFFVSKQAMLCAISALYEDASEEELPKCVLPLKEQLEEFERVAKRYPFEGEAEMYRSMLKNLQH